MRPPIDAICYLLDAQFPADGILALGYICQRGIIQDIGNGISYIAHHQPQAAGFFIGTTTSLIGHLAYTFNGSYRAVQHTEDLSQGDLAG